MINVHSCFVLCSINMDVRLKCPFTSIVSGATMTGKSTFVSELIAKKDLVLDTIISDVIICFSQWQDSYKTLQGTCRFVEGVIDPDELDPSIPHLCILDDLQSSNDPRIEQLFVRSCHHRNTSCVYICQTLYSKNKGHRTCSLNAQYLILFKSPRDQREIRTLETQIFPGMRNYLVDSFKDACEEPYHYLFIDLKPHTPSHLRLRGRVLDQENQDVYLPKCYKWSPHTSE